VTVGALPPRDVAGRCQQTGTSSTRPMTCALH